MKKAICMILVLFALMTSVIASAEKDRINFALGLDLGMSASEAALTTGVKCLDIISNFSVDTQESIRKNGIYGSHYLLGNATIAGYDVSIKCYTDEQDNICQIRYNFDNATSEQYQEIEASLQKYGNEHYQGGKPITSGVKDEVLASPSATIKTTVIDNFDRVIPYNEGTVLIEHCYYIMDTSSPYISPALTGPKYSHMLCYSYINAKLTSNETIDADF